MEVYVWMETLWEGGGSFLFEPVSHLLWQRLKGHNTKCHVLRISASLAENPESVTRDEVERFGALPKCVFSSKRSELDISFLSTKINAREGLISKLSLDSYNTAKNELRDWISNLAPKIKKKKGLNGTLLVDLCMDALKDDFQSLEEIALLNSEVSLLRKNEENEELVFKKGAHPNAVEILKEDFFWSEGDSFSPHGSDLGLQLWSEYQSKKIGKGNETLNFLVKIFEELGIDETLYRRYEVTLAILFAEIKVHGTISLDGKEIMLK